MRGVVVIGAGHAGVEAAASLRAGGYSGPVTLVGAERHLPYRRPPLSKEVLGEGADPEDLALRPEAFFAERRIDLRPGPALEIDRAGRVVHIAGERSVNYDHVVLATGSTARRLDIAGRSLRGVAELRSLDDALALRALLVGAKRIVVLGGGFIGLEVASAARGRGLEVSVIEVADRLLGRVVTAPVSAAVAAHHRAGGVRLHFGERATELVGRAGHVVGVRTARGRVLPADLVVLGVGATAEDGLARRAALAVDGGVLVDQRLVTSDPRISAIGDCAVMWDPATGTRQRLESVQNATDQGRYVAARLLGEHRPYRALPWFWSDQGSLRLQLVNVAAESDQLVLRGDEGRFSVLCLRAGLLTAVESVNDPGTHLAARRLLERMIPGEAELAAVDYDLRVLARRAMARGAAVA
jgi:3-phenylpropionate/trans-cinnamate dioxygenase ferredoxin reductase subunit